ncbi:MAG: hypothetical protein HXX80_06360, partial [Nitrososphaerales archaeon]|nr:hypothetical protein [Nitrososphaerales archaeon]
SVRSVQKGGFILTETFRVTSMYENDKWVANVEVIVTPDLNSGVFSIPYTVTCEGFASQGITNGSLEVSVGSPIGLPEWGLFAVGGPTFPFVWLWR